MITTQETLARPVSLSNAATAIFATLGLVDALIFDVQPGTVTGFLGPNGSGKSTTMRMIIGLDRPDAGRARIGGQRYPELGWPLREVGALLEAKSFHSGRTAREANR